MNLRGEAELVSGSRLDPVAALPVTYDLDIVAVLEDEDQPVGPFAFMVRVKSNKCLLCNLCCSVEGIYGVLLVHG